MRDGRLVETRRADDITAPELIRLMVGERYRKSQLCVPFIHARYSNSDGRARTEAFRR